MSRVRVRDPSAIVFNFATDVAIETTGGTTRTLAISACSVEAYRRNVAELAGDASTLTAAQKEELGRMSE